MLVITLFENSKISVDNPAVLPALFYLDSLFTSSAAVNDNIQLFAFGTTALCGNRKINNIIIWNVNSIVLLQWQWRQKKGDRNVDCVYYLLIKGDSTFFFIH